MRLVAPVVGLAAVVVLAACASVPDAKSTTFHLPTLKVDELRRLVSETNRAGGDPAQAFARVICEAKGLRFGGESYGRCEDSLKAAIKARPEALARARELAGLAERYSAATEEGQARVPEPGRASLCYDLARSIVTECEDT